MNKDEITKYQITKYQWRKYRKLQRMGIINMNDIRRGAFLIGESPEVYETIINNYSYLRSKFNN